MRRYIRIAQTLLAIDGAILLCYGGISLLFVPGSPNEPYLSHGRLLYGVIPAVLGLGSIIYALCLTFARPKNTLSSD